MTAENVTNNHRFEEALDAISQRGEITRATVEEFTKGLSEGNIRVTLTPSLTIWRVGGDLQATGKAYVFLAESSSQESLEGQAIDIMIEALALTRKLSGPRLKEMDELENVLRREALVKG